MFNHYTDPIKAKKVYSEYFPDLSNYDCISEARDIIRDCSNPDELDLKLDALITPHIFDTKRCASSPVSEDRDAQGFRTVALRALEDS